MSFISRFTQSISSWFSSKEASLFKKWDISWLRDTLQLGHIALSFLSGFVIGYLCHRYIRLVIIVTLAALIVGKWLEMQHIIVFDWGHIYKAVGVTPHDDASVLLDMIGVWVNTHLLLIISTLLGFLAGHKLST